jgi:hypothetical protein
MIYHHHHHKHPGLGHLARSVSRVKVALYIVSLVSYDIYLLRLGFQPVAVKMRIKLTSYTHTYKKLNAYKCKGKGKGHPTTRQKGPKLE